MALNINGTTGISGVDGSLSAPAIAGTDSNSGITFPSADTIKFSTGGVERLSIDNTGCVGAGKIIQVQHNLVTDQLGFATTSTSYVTHSNLPTLSITPTRSTSKIYVSSYIGMQWDNGDQVENTIYRFISGGATTELSGNNTYGLVFKGGATTEYGYAGVQFVDSPSTTSQVTYTWYARSEFGGSVSPNHGGCAFAMTLMEIEA